MQEYTALGQEILRCKKQYEKVLKEALRIIQLELDGLSDEDFEPSTGVIATSLDMIKKVSALAALTDAETMSINEVKDKKEEYIPRLTEVQRSIFLS